MIDAPDGSVQKTIEAKVSNEEEAKKAIADWMAKPENNGFVQDHAYIEKWKPAEGAAKPSIIAFFKKTGSGDGADKPGGKRASPLRNGNGTS